MAKLWGKWTTVVWWYGLLGTVSFYAVLAVKNKEYHISSLCDRKRSQQLYHKADGAVLTSNNEGDLDCTITFQTDSVLQKFMLRFEELQLDCNDHLYIFDGTNAFHNYEADLSCRNNQLEVGTIYTRSNCVTLRYVTHGWGQIGNGFRLVLTAFKDTPLECRGFRCQNNLCIHAELTCDHVNHCGDNSDESSHALCPNNEFGSRILGLGVGIFIVIIVSTFIFCFVCVAGIGILFYRRMRRRPPQHGVLNTNQSYPSSYLETAPLLHCACSSNDARAGSWQNPYFRDRNRDFSDDFDPQILPKVPEESACSEKTQVNTMNSVSVFHSATGLPPNSCGPPREAPALPGKPSVSPSSGRDRLQCSPGKHLLPNKVKSGLSRSQKKCNNSSREKGEWLV